MASLNLHLKKVEMKVYIVYLYIHGVHVPIVKTYTKLNLLRCLYLYHCINHDGTFEYTDTSTLYIETGHKRYLVVLKSVL